MGPTALDMTEIGTDWRVVDGVATAWFDARSLIEGAALAGRIVELSPEIELAVPSDLAQTRLATIRFCRPLAIGLNPADERTIAHRQLDSYLDGLMMRSGLPGNPTPCSRTGVAAGAW